MQADLPNTHDWTIFDEGLRLDILRSRVPMITSIWMPSIPKTFQPDSFDWKLESSGEVCLDPIHLASLDRLTLKYPSKIRPS